MDHPYITSAKDWVGGAPWGQKNDNFWWCSVLYLSTYFCCHVGWVRKSTKCADIIYGWPLKVNLFTSHNIVTSRQRFHFSDLWIKLIILRWTSALTMAKVRQSWKQIWDNFQYIKLSQRLSFGRNEDTIICFQDCLTFSSVHVGQSRSSL